MSMQHRAKRAIKETATFVVSTAVVATFELTKLSWKLASSAVKLGVKTFKERKAKKETQKETDHQEYMEAKQKFEEKYEEKMSQYEPEQEQKRTRVPLMNQGNQATLRQIHEKYSIKDKMIQEAIEFGDGSRHTGTRKHFSPEQNERFEKIDHLYKQEAELLQNNGSTLLFKDYTDGGMFAKFGILEDKQQEAFAKGMKESVYMGKGNPTAFKKQFATSLDAEFVEASKKYQYMIKHSETKKDSFSQSFWQGRFQNLRQEYQKQTQPKQQFQKASGFEM